MSCHRLSALRAEPGEPQWRRTCRPSRTPAVASTGRCSAMNPGGLAPASRGQPGVTFSTKTVDVVDNPHRDRLFRPDCRPAEGMPTLPHLPPSASSRRVSRRGFLAASAVAVPAAWAFGTSGVASAAPARRAEGTSSAVALAWHDITSQAVQAANFAEPVTQSRRWAVDWLAAARALRRTDRGDFAVAAFAQALHDTLAAQVPGRRASLAEPGRHARVGPEQAGQESRVLGERARHVDRPGRAQGRRPRHRLGQHP